MLLPRDLEVLVIESQAAMRAQLRTMLASIGIDSAQFAVSAMAAVKRLRSRRYDLILCEYNLGEGQDGQHLLEDLGAQGLLPLDTVFVMITAERNYERVISACELAPDDYILKPLNAETLRVRLQRTLAKRDRFLPIWQRMQLGDPVGAIQRCTEARAQHPLHLTDLMRLQAQLHSQIGQLDEAEELYREILAAHSVPWAELGVARILVLKKRELEAEQRLTTLLARHEQFIAAYELLARIQERDGRTEEACATLQAAVEKSPHRLARLRQLGTLALRSANPAAAAAAFAEVVRKGKYSEFPDAEDHVRLVQAQLGGGQPDAARATIADLERQLAREPAAQACKSICIALMAAHEHDQAGARAALDARGLGTLAQKIEAHVQAEIKSLLTAGAEKARSGDFDGAVSTMMHAARKLPGNPQVLFNAALALLRHIEHKGWNEVFATQAYSLVQRARELAPTNPRLAALTQLMHELIERYGIRADKITARMARDH